MNKLPCHSRGSFIKKRAKPLQKGLLAEMTEVRQAVCSDRRSYLLTTVDAQDRDNFEKPEEVERMDYLEFIARVTSHISDKGQAMIRYYGLC